MTVLPKAAWPAALVLCASTALGQVDSRVPTASHERGAAGRTAVQDARRTVPSRATLVAIARDLQRVLGVEVELEMLTSAPDRALTLALRVGQSGGGHALVIGDFTGASTWRLEERTREAATTARALLKGSVATRLRAEGASLVFLLGSADRAEAQHGGVRFERNFPADWGLARRLDPDGAGPYPASRADVASIVDWVGDRRDLFGLLDVRSGVRTSADAPKPGSLRAYCEYEARIDHERAVLDGGAAAKGLGQLLIRRTHAVVTDRQVTLVAPGAWIVDLTLSIRGSGAADPVAFKLHAVPSAGDVGAPWIGCSEAPLATDGERREPLRVVPVRDGRCTLLPAVAGDHRQVRLFVHLPNSTGRGAAASGEAPRTVGGAKTDDATIGTLDVVFSGLRCRTNRQKIPLAGR